MRGMCSNFTDRQAGVFKMINKSIESWAMLLREYFAAECSAEESVYGLCTSIEFRGVTDFPISIHSRYVVNESSLMKLRVILC